MLGIFIITYNIPAEVFLLQIAAIKKFCKDEYYRIIVADNSSDDELSEGIRYHSARLELIYAKTNASSVNSSDSHSWAANFIYHKYAKTFRYFFFLDHDCIPVREFSVLEILGEKYIAGIGQAKEKTYFWPGCLLWDGHEIPVIDFSPNSKYGLDTGGNTYEAIEVVGEKKCVFFDESYHQNPDFKGKYDCYAMINDEMFLHFIAGSNWSGVDDHEKRLNSLINITKQKAAL